MQIMAYTQGKSDVEEWSIHGVDTSMVLTIRHALEAQLLEVHNKMIEAFGMRNLHLLGDEDSRRSRSRMTLEDYMMYSSQCSRLSELIFLIDTEDGLG